MMNIEENARAVTLRDIARELGVSHSAVSLALRGSPKVSPGLRDIARETAVRLNYQPNAFASMLALHRRQQAEPTTKAALAWLTFSPDAEANAVSQPTIQAYRKGAQKAAAEAGYRLDEFCFPAPQSLIRLEKILFSRGIEGLVLPPNALPVDWAQFHWEKFSVVRCGHSISAPLSNLVTSHELANMERMVWEVFHRGYRRIGYVSSSPADLKSLSDAGFFMAQGAIPGGHPHLPPLHLEPNKGGPATLNHWVREHRPDVILTDVPNLRILLEQRGFRVPEDVAIAVTNVAGAECDTGMDLRADQIGRLALHTLLSSIRDFEKGLPDGFRQVLVEGQWTDGSHCPRRS